LFLGSRSAPLQSNITALRRFSAQPCPVTVRNADGTQPAAGISHGCHG